MDACKIVQGGSRPPTKRASHTQRCGWRQWSRRSCMGARRGPSAPGPRRHTLHHTPPYSAAERGNESQRNTHPILNRLREHRDYRADEAFPLEQVRSFACPTTQTIHDQQRTRRHGESRTRREGKELAWACEERHSFRVFGIYSFNGGTGS